MGKWDDEESSYEAGHTAAIGEIADAMEEWEARGEPTSGPHWEAEVRRIQESHGV